MSAQKGRLMLLKVGDGSSPQTFSTLGGLRTKSLTIGNDQVNITDDDNAPWRQLLADAGERKVTISGSGIFKDDTAANAIENLSFNGNLEEFQMVNPSGDIIQGQFQVASFEYSGPTTDAQQFNITLESGGTVTLSRA